MDTIEINRSEYDELKSRPEQAKLDEAVQRAEKAERDLEAAETAKVAAESDKAELQKKVDAAEETARQASLRDERLESLGAGFVAKLGDKTKERLRTQAGQLADAEWTARLDELEELTGAKRDAGKEDAAKQDGGTTFTSEEIARHQGTGAPRADGEPTLGQRRTVFAGL